MWDSWLRRDSLKAIGRTFGKPSLLFIAGWPPVLRRPVEITGVKRTCNNRLTQLRAVRNEVRSTPRSPFGPPVVPIAARTSRICLPGKLNYRYYYRRSRGGCYAFSLNRCSDICVVGAICFWVIEKFVNDSRLANLLKILVVLICAGAILQRVLPLAGINWF